MYAWPRAFKSASIKLKVVHQIQMAADFVRVTSHENTILQCHKVRVSYGGGGGGGGGLGEHPGIPPIPE